MDKIRKYFNSNQAKFGINILYSTPSCYLKSLHEAKEMKWNVKTDDFFPYASDPHAYWTGYFTSRSTLKGMIRESNSLLQACKQINALYGGQLADERLEMTKRAVSVFLLIFHRRISGKFGLLYSKVQRRCDSFLN